MSSIIALSIIIAPTRHAGLERLSGLRLDPLGRPVVAVVGGAGRAHHAHVLGGQELVAEVAFMNKALGKQGV